MVTSSCKRKGAADETYLSQKSSNLCSTSKAHLVTCTFKINCQVQCLGQPRHNFCLIQYLFSMGTLVWAESVWSADPSSNVLSKMIIQDKGLVFISLTKMKLLIDNKCTIFFSSRFQIPVWNPSLLHLSISTRSYWMSVSFYSMQFRFMSAVHANWTLIVFPDMMIQL